MEKDKSLYEKLMLITSELETLEKKLEVKINKDKSYKAVDEKTILEAVKPLEKKYRIYSYPVDRKIVDADVLTKETEYNDKITTTNTLFLRLEITYRFINIDNPSEFIDVKSYGDGMDTGDKAPGKAMTYADKYALMKAYKIATGDDPDKDPSPENGYKKITKTATKSQLEILNHYYKDENLEKLLTKHKINSLEELSIEKASALIKKIHEYEVKKGNE